MAIAHVPPKCAHFGDKHLRKHLRPERFLIGEAIPLRRETLGQENEMDLRNGFDIKRYIRTIPD
jgi:hypothetical protein